MFSHGYCSGCNALVLLAALQAHQEESHAGDLTFLTFYRPDPVHMAANLLAADQLAQTTPEADSGPPSPAASGVPTESE